MSENVFLILVSHDTYYKIGNNIWYTLYSINGNDLDIATVIIIIRILNINNKINNR